MVRLMHWLAPKNRELFRLLGEQSRNALEGAKELKIFMDDYQSLERGERKSRAYAIERIEEKGDGISKRIFGLLSRNSGADAIHIRRAAVLLDDIADLMNAAASMLVVLSIERIDKHMLRLMGIANDSVIEADKIVSSMGNAESRAKAFLLEEEAGKAYNDALSDLFHFHRHSIDIMKYREIYDILKSVAGKCRSLSDAIEDIAKRH